MVRYMDALILACGGLSLLVLSLHWDDSLTLALAIILLTWGFTQVFVVFVGLRDARRESIRRALGKPPEICSFNPKRRYVERINQENKP